MVERKTWDEFRSAQLLWWVNRMLHIFGWAIVVEVGDDGCVTNAYPARVKYRGFDAASEAEGFAVLSKYIEENAAELSEEARQ